MTNKEFRKQALQIIQLTKDFIGIELSMSDLFKPAESYQQLVNYSLEDLNRMKWFVEWSNSIQNAEIDLMAKNSDWNKTTFTTLHNALQWMDITDEKFDDFKDFIRPKQK